MIVFHMLRDRLFETRRHSLCFAERRPYLWLFFSFLAKVRADFCRCPVSPKNPTKSSIFRSFVHFFVVVLFNCHRVSSLSLSVCIFYDFGWFTQNYYHFSNLRNKFSRPKNGHYNFTKQMINIECNALARVRCRITALPLAITWMLLSILGMPFARTIFICSPFLRTRSCDSFQLTSFRIERMRTKSNACKTKLFYCRNKRARWKRSDRETAQW